MYTFFIGYSDVGAPSFEKFARSIGVTLKDLENFKKNKTFCKAWHECSEIRRDYLIDTALTKRHDASFTKFLLGCEFGMGDEKKNDTTAERINVTLEVLTK